MYMERSRQAFRPYQYLVRNQQGYHLRHCKARRKSTEISTRLISGKKLTGMPSRSISGKESTQIIIRLCQSRRKSTEISTRSISGKKSV